MEIFRLNAPMSDPREIFRLAIIRTNDEFEVSHIEFPQDRFELWVLQVMLENLLERIGHDLDGGRQCLTRF
jgi:hypothetical protein